MTEIFIDRALTEFNSLTKKPEKFLSEPHSLIENVKNLLKQSYDYSKKEEKDTLTETLKELVIKDFDVEQIWQQIELQNSKLLDNSLLHVSKLLAAKDTSLWFEIDQQNDDSSESASETENTNEIDDKSDESKSENEEISEKSDQESISDEKIEKKSDKSVPKFRKSVVDDDFFKLDEMEQFLRREESGKVKKKLKTDESDSENESIDLFNSDIDEISDDDTKNNPKYDDFFENSEEKDDISKENEDKSDKSGESDSEIELSDLDNLKNDENFTDNENDDDLEQNIEKSESSDEEIDKTELKSSLEVRQERLKKKIEQIENAALEEKSWQLKGEITAQNRPINSLLEEVVDFDLTSRPAPVITQETTYKLEDIIKQRIKDKAFDSVERKMKPIEAPTEYKKKLVLDQEKSKQSLAQIYENEYLKQKEALDPNFADKEEEVPKEHIEIKTLMKNLFAKLDSLSNFHFTPKQVVPELKVVNNLPAISMEEVAPLAVSDAALLAPEEVKNKPKGDIIGKGERTKTDKKRERRKKKQKQKVHAIEKEKKEQKMEGKTKISKNKANSLIEKITKNRNITKMDENARTVKSSTAFFSQLEDEVKSHINSKQKRKNTDKSGLVAKKIKL